ncbi:MAG: hypothetical protein L6R41_006132 [Letrouitia leprolyta]|nr:MAG: hypothetical protein L6R41_006132 [Letrouitia leprolyta]
MSQPQSNNSPVTLSPKKHTETEKVSASHRKLTSDLPVIANFDSAHLTIGAGVAIFHIATARVVVCYHSVDGYWFLPKGRRDAGEDSGTGAEREGFEESGYRNRLLPIPLRHRQPQAHHPSNPPSPYVTEPLWTQMMPVSRSSQYILFWYIAETLPPDLENTLSQQSKQQEDGAYQIPERFPRNLTLKERVALEGEGYEPVRHENTGVDEEERLYDSCLLPVEEAVGKLKGTVMADVVRRGWEGICERREMEDAVGSGEVS